MKIGGFKWRHSLAAYTTTGAHLGRKFEVMIKYSRPNGRNVWTTRMLSGAAPAAGAWKADQLAAVLPVTYDTAALAIANAGAQLYKLFGIVPERAAEDRIKIALELIRRHGGHDGEHHKAWVIDQVARALAGDDYDRMVADARSGTDGPHTYDWDTGIAP